MALVACRECGTGVATHMALVCNRSYVREKGCREFDASSPARGESSVSGEKFTV